MIQEFFDKHIFLYIMGGLCGLGVLLKCFLLIVYNRLISSSENMTHTKRNWLKNMKTRFESSYQLQLGVNDVDTYVDKYVSKIKCGGLLLSTWENISGQTIGLCLLTGSFAGILGFIYECGKGPVLFTFFTGAWTAIIVNIVDNIVNISAHKQMLRFNLIDYFENNLKVRMEQEVFHPEARRKYQREYFDEERADDHAAEGSSFSRHGLKGSRAVAATVEPPVESSKENEVPKQSDHSPVVKLSWREKRKQKKQEKRQAKRERQQVKYDAKAAKKKQKEDAAAAKKQAKQDAIDAKKQSRQKSKQSLIDEKNMKKAKKEEAREAKERAEIKALQLKKQAKEEEKEQREKIEQDRKQKELQNNKAYKEKMRLKEEKQREAAKREEKNRMKEEQVDNDRKSVNLNTDSLNEIDESFTKQQLRGAIKEINKDRIKVVEENDTMEYENDQNDEPSEMTAISKEEDLLIEEVLKDFLS